MNDYNLQSTLIEKFIPLDCAVQLALHWNTRTTELNFSGALDCESHKSDDVPASVGYVAV